MGLFSKKIGVIFFKEDSNANTYIQELQTMLQKATGNNAKDIEKEINFIKAGQRGEENVAYELKNSGMDMYVLHDICLRQGNLSAQIDYLVITRKRTYVIECKMLTGDVEIDSTGAFIRKYEFSGKTIREGFYSPVTQNQMHLQVIKEVWKNNRLNFFNRGKFERDFDDNFQSIVVLSNPKTCINMEYAPKEVKEQVIRADQLIEYIRQKDNISYNEMRDSDMLEVSQFYLSQHNPSNVDYSKKFEKLSQKTNSIVQNFTNEKTIIEYHENQYPTPNNKNFFNSLTDFPFTHIHNECDIMHFSNSLLTYIKHTCNFSNLYDEAASLWLQATIGYLWYEAPEDKKNISTLLYMLESDEFKRNNGTHTNAVDMLYDELERKNSQHYAVIKRKEFKNLAGKNAQYVIDTLIFGFRSFTIIPNTKTDTETNTNNIEETIKKELKKFRLEQSKIEGIKPYYIFKDVQMEDLLEKMPKTKDELLNVSGFGTAKVNKYGDEILKILWRK